MKNVTDFRKAVETGVDLRLDVSTLKGRRNHYQIFLSCSCFEKTYGNNFLTAVSIKST